VTGELDGSLLHRCAVLALRFGVLAIFALGNGASGMIPQMHHEFVTRDHWLDELTFSQLLAVSQATPGPNFLIVSLIGWRVASWPGAFVVYVAFLAAPTAIALTVGRLVRRHDTPLLLLVRRAVRPMTSALWLATGAVIALINDKTPVDIGVTVVVAAGSLLFERNPLWWCLGAAIVGAAIG
jgi:chromate transporter